MAETGDEIKDTTARNQDVGHTGAKRSRLESCLDQPEESSIYEVIKYGPSPLPAKHYDPDTTEPTSCGLHTMEELLSWRRSEASPFNVASVPLAPREPSLGSCLRRTLVSHDMMGGYLDDRFIQGTNAETPYAFYHWCYIDIFNYFTHQLVSIPPAVWTNAAHKHGVIVLGTFITEWTDGATKCEAFLKTEESYRSVADKLVQISQCYGFDGWLINIENPLSEAAVKNAPLFLQYLTEQMHERVPSSVVLWYDSVIQSGELKWQNELNQSNRMFFDSCDGFFTNYNWTEQSLESMKEYSGVQGRQADVYVGVDVFARGEVVGGMLETNKALDLIRKHNFSTAIFAPGWVYELLEDKTEFRQKQDKFWALLLENLYVHRPASPLPFASSFCQGFGKALYWRGQKEKTSSWFNLSAQDLQPLYSQMDLEGGGWLRSSGCPEEAWSGGCSLLLDGLMPADLSAPACARIFSLHVPLDSRILVALIYKASPGISVSLQLNTTDVHHFSQSGPQDVKTISLTPEALDNGHQLMKHFPHASGNLNTHGWTVRCSELEFHGSILREVCVLIQRHGEPRDVLFSCRLGKIMVVDIASLEAPPPAVQGVCVEDLVWLRGSGTSPQQSSLLNATLRWEYSSELVHHFKVHWRRLRGPDPHVPPGQLELVGRAHANLFRVTELAVPKPPSLLELVVEPVLLMDVPVPEELWGRRQLSYTEAVAQ
ncbi:Cytosolic endo-beta-N-acetylglucosaminidase [Oryzias melastigma]|uniref:Cytosolic endo-beta-N-acetylglucosaminidase n=1 Tax=Oryzias melastigma TaxID=30732 RepID=A0A834EZU2_ORYME|nr:Cytosolic endo-beta-N-acetylglucosaminidase [Oryzias melastigma]